MQTSCIFVASGFVIDPHILIFLMFNIASFFTVPIANAWWLDICQSAPLMHLGLMALYKCIYLLTYFWKTTHTQHFTEKSSRLCG